MAASNIVTPPAPRQRDFVMIADVTGHRIAVVSKDKTAFKFHSITIRAPYSGECIWDEHLDLRAIHEKMKPDTKFYFCIRREPNDTANVWAMPANLAAQLKDIFACKVAFSNMAANPFLSAILRHPAVDVKNRDWLMNETESYFKEEFLPFSPCDVFSETGSLTHLYHMQDLIFLEKPAALAYPVFRHRDQIVAQFSQEAPLFYGYKNCRACHHPPCLKAETADAPLIVCPACSITAYCSEKCMQDDKPRHASNCMTEQEREIRNAIDIEQIKFLRDMDKKEVSFSKDQINELCNNIATNVRSEFIKKG